MITFDQQYMPVMIFMLLCFAGLMVMFYFMLRGMEELTRGMREERNDVVKTLRAVEKGLAQLVSLQRQEGVMPPAHVHYGRNGDVVFDERDASHGDTALHVSAAPAPAAQPDNAASFAEGTRRDDFFPEMSAPQADDSAAYSEAMDFDEASERIADESMPQIALRDAAVRGSRSDRSTLLELRDSVMAHAVSVSEPAETFEYSDTAELPVAVADELHDEDRAEVYIEPSGVTAIDADVDSEFDAIFESIEASLADAALRDVDPEAGHDEASGGDIAATQTDSAPDASGEPSVVEGLGESMDMHAEQAVRPETAAEQEAVSLAESELPDLHLSGDAHTSEVTGLFLLSAASEGAASSRTHSATVQQSVPSATGLHLNSYPQASRDYFSDSLYGEDDEDDVILLTPDEIVVETDDQPAATDDAMLDRAVADDDADDLEGAFVFAALEDASDDSSGSVAPAIIDDEEPLDMDSALAKALAAAGIPDDELVADGQRYLSDTARADIADDQPAGDAADFEFSGDEGLQDDKEQTVLPGFFEGNDPVVISDGSVEGHSTDAGRVRGKKESESDERAVNITEFIVPE